MSINDRSEIRTTLDDFHMELLDIRNSCAGQHSGQAKTASDLVIMNWTPKAGSSDVGCFNVLLS